MSIYKNLPKTSHSGNDWKYTKQVARIYKANFLKKKFTATALMRMIQDTQTANEITQRFVIVSFKTTRRFVIQSPSHTLLAEETHHLSILKLCTEKIFSGGKFSANNEHMWIHAFQHVPAKLPTKRSPNYFQKQTH